MARTGSVSPDSKLAMALASGCSPSDAAEIAGMSERTARRRIADPSFSSLVHQIRSSMFEGAVGQLADAASRAVDTLCELLSAPVPTVRLGAARAILEIGPRLRESFELEHRLAEIERRAEHE